MSANVVDEKGYEHVPECHQRLFRCVCTHGRPPYDEPDKPTSPRSVDLDAARRVDMARALEADAAKLRAMGGDPGGTLEGLFDNAAPCDCGEDTCNLIEQCCFHAGGPCGPYCGIAGYCGEDDDVSG